MNRQRAILAALLILFAGSIIYSFVRMPKQERVAKLTYQPGMSAKPVTQPQSSGSDVARVRLDPPVQAVAPPPVASAPQVVEPTPMQREMATFTFLGFLKKDNRKTIFLSNDKEIFVVKKGDKISGKYDVTALTEEAITITSLESGGEIVIPLVENRPLAAPRN